MNVQILEKPAFLVTGKVLLTSQSDNTIPQFWQQCNQDGTSDFLCYFAEGMVTSNAMLGVCYGSQPDGSFHYLAGVETTKAPKIQERELKADGAVKVVEKIAPAVKDGRLVLVLSQLIVDVLKLDSLGI